jgi:hypothetical protein
MPGYVGYGQTASGPLSAPSGLRKATIVLFWATSALTLVLGLFAYQRGDVARDFFVGTKSLTDAQDADNRVGALALLVILVQVAAAIVLAVWSHRTVGNAKRRDPSLPASVGLAAGGWFIPIGNYWVPWQQLRKSARRFGQLSSALTTWQILFLVSAITAVVARAFGTGNAESADDAVSRLHAQGIFFVIGGVVSIIATVMAARAMAEVDRATSGQTTV